MMPYQTAKIKDLSIALEAISRINGASTFSYEIENLLSHAIKAAQKENKQDDNPTPPVATITNDDDIPF